MDGAALAGLAGGLGGGIPTLAIILLAKALGKWQGTMEQRMNGHDKEIDSQKATCKEQKESCGKRFDYVQSRVNHVQDEK